MCIYFLYLYFLLHHFHFIFICNPWRCIFVCSIFLLYYSIYVICMWYWSWINKNIPPPFIRTVDRLCAVLLCLCLWVILFCGDLRWKPGAEFWVFLLLCLWNWIELNWLGVVGKTKQTLCQVDWTLRLWDELHTHTQSHTHTKPEPFFTLHRYLTPPYTAKLSHFPFRWEYISTSTPTSSIGCAGATALLA